MCVLVFDVFPPPFFFRAVCDYRFPSVRTRLLIDRVVPLLTCFAKLAVSRFSCGIFCEGAEKGDTRERSMAEWLFLTKATGSLRASRSNLAVRLIAVVAWLLAGPGSHPGLPRVK